MSVQSIIQLLGGVGLFLFAIKLISEALQLIAGDRLRQLIVTLTKTPIMGVLVGACVTVLIQSSSATTVMTVSFVDAGLMTLTQAIGVIMGANIGTTITGQILAIKVQDYAYLFIIIGVLLSFFGRSKVQKYAGNGLLGFGLLFVGMQTMESSMSFLRNEKELFLMFSHNPLMGVLAGTLLTLLVQSSAATVGLTIALGVQGLLPLHAAIPIILGAHIGTAFTPLLTIGGSSKDGKRAALIHLYFNIIGSVILLALVYAVQFTIGIPMWGDVMNKSSIANIHTMTSVIAMLLFLPCSGVLSKLAMMTVPNSAEEAQELSMPVLDERLFKSPAVALQQAKNAVVKMSRRAARNVGLATPLLLKMDEDVVSAIDVRENLIDRMEVEISNYLIKLADQELGDAESHEVTELLNFVTECERIGDYAVNIKEKAQELTDKEVTFSEKAQQELKLLDNALEKILTLTTDAFEFDDARTASQVEPLEQVIDILVERLRAQHIKRLKDGACSIDTGVVYLDVLNNVERISDHCSNIAARLVGMEAGEDYDSHTLKNMMHHNPTKEYMLNYEQCRKDYLIPLEQLEA